MGRRIGEVAMMGTERMRRYLATQRAAKKQLKSAHAAKLAEQRAAAKQLESDRREEEPPQGALDGGDAG
jgi:hypothetical protein